MNPPELRNFSPRAQMMLALARKEADRLHINYVGTEHLFLGLIKLGQGAAVAVLSQLGVSLETARIEVEKLVLTGPDQVMFGHGQEGLCVRTRNIPYTPRVKNVLTIALKEATALNRPYVGTEHILLGLLMEGDGIAARVLNDLGVDSEKARTEIIRQIEPTSGSDIAGGNVTPG
jgi:ATP-dependent Clp protease ATP-binding subunit ClpC